jgi:hypothetical protein
MCDRDARKLYPAHLFKRPENYYTTLKIIDRFERISDIALTIMDGQMMKLQSKYSMLEKEFGKIEDKAMTNALIEIEKMIKDKMYSQAIKACELGSEMLSKIQMGRIKDKQFSSFIKQIEEASVINGKLKENLETITYEFGKTLFDSLETDGDKSNKKIILGIIELIPFIVEITNSLIDLTDVAVSVGEYIIDGYEINAPG